MVIAKSITSGIEEAMTVTYCKLEEFRHGEQCLLCLRLETYYMHIVLKIQGVIKKTKIIQSFITKK